ncbi:MAG: hypothetical protein ACK5AZ_11585 [Bryobacteraceae bacterium]
MNQRENIAKQSSLAPLRHRGSSFLRRVRPERPGFARFPAPIVRAINAATPMTAKEAAIQSTYRQPVRG